MGRWRTVGRRGAFRILNAIFDATGARIRSVPFTPDKVREALRRGA